MRKKYFVIFIAILVNATVYSQEHTIYKSFDEEPIDFSKIKKDINNPGDVHHVFAPTYSEGLKGLCLNMTNDVAVRVPIPLDAEETLSYDKSFAFEVWVKTKKGARQATPIMSNKKVADKNKAGWILGTDVQGAWFFNISDGKSTYNYAPTAERQSINDGQWHQIAVSVDLAKKEMWLYFDGENVAIYNIESLAHSSTEFSTVIGGSDENNEWGSRGEWTAFNGMIDEVKMYNKPINTSLVKNSYNESVTPREEKKIVPVRELKVQVWNIWHGGHRFGEHVGVERVIDVLKKSNADVIGLIETYGSGEVIADSLGYHFYLISSNLSIMSRYPIDETIKVFNSFNSGGAILNLGNGNKLAFFDIWLDYLPDSKDMFFDRVEHSAFMKEENDRRGKEMKEILKQIETYTLNADNIPVIMVGDFNSGSHLDWIESTKSIHRGKIMKWPASISMEQAQYKDSYREMNKDILMNPGYTWSPLYSTSAEEPTWLLDRIDYIYYKSKKLQPYWSKVVDQHPIFWPSDHGSVFSYFYLNYP